MLASFWALALSSASFLASFSADFSAFNFSLEATTSLQLLFPEVSVLRILLALVPKGPGNKVSF